MVDINSMVKVTDDSEMQMAKSDLYNMARNCVELYKILKDLPELEGWTQAKITKAADYINSVLNYMKYESRGQVMELSEMASSGGTSSGAIATVPMNMNKKKPIKRENVANWKATVQSIPKTGTFKHKKIVIKTPGGKTYTFDTEDEARRMFPDSWDKIKSGLKGFEVTGLNEEAVWDKPNPVKKHKKLSPAQKSKAKARAQAAGRKYPNMVDNIWAAKN